MNKIAIAVSTYNRKATFLRWCHNMWLNSPEGCNVFVIDAGSDTDYATNADYRFQSRATISEAKNKCLQLCYESGAEHIFLFDDDTIVLKKGWELPYINSGEHHLCATFFPWTKIHLKASSNFNIKCDGDIGIQMIQLKEHRLANGYGLYFSRHCIETVGGFDTKYNNKFEHVDISRRIFNAGLTKHMFQDVVGSEELIYCLDKDNAIQRSFTNREMQDNLKAGYEYFQSQANSSKYIEFRT